MLKGHVLTAITKYNLFFKKWGFSSFFDGGCVYAFDPLTNGSNTRYPIGRLELFSLVYLFLYSTYELIILKLLISKMCNIVITRKL